MNKEQSLHKFWNSFDVPAYDSITVPDEMRNVYPRITYNVVISEFGIPTALMASIWDKSTSWERITGIAEKIDSEVSNGGKMTEYTDGMIWIKKGTPFMSRMADPDDTIRRIIVNVEIEYLEGKK